MDEATAREIIKVSIRGMALFDQLLETLRTRLPLQEYEIHKRRIAGVMTEISVELMSPIYTDQPLTEPGDVDAWTSAGQLHEPNWLSGPVQPTAFTTRS